MSEPTDDGLRRELHHFYRTSDTYLKMLRTPLSMSIDERDAYYRAYVELVVSAAPGPGSRILDLGCGIGRTSDGLADLGFRVVASDWSDMLIRAGISERGRHPAVRYVLADAERLPFADESFDVVASLDLLEHTLRPQAVLAEAARVLVPGGALVVKCPNLLSPLRPLWYLLRLLLQRRATPVWADNAVVALRGIAFNTAVTASKLILGRPGFLSRRPSLAEPGLADDADATYYASPIDVRRWMVARGLSLVGETRLANDNAAQRIVRRALPDLASPIALVARRPAGGS